MIIIANLKNRWLAPYYVPNHRAKVRLFCLPYAGSGAMLYRKWSSILSDKIDVCPIQLPGRENRLNENNFTDLKKLSLEVYYQIIDFLDKPYFIFGHSMGGIIGYELARIIEKEGRRMPQWIYMSASSVYAQSYNSHPVYNLSNNDLKEYINKYIANLPEVENERYQENFFPVIRRDYYLVENYHHSHDKPLSCAIHSFLSESDKVFTTDLIEGMQNLTHDFRMHYINGNHLFINYEYEKMCKIIKDEIFEESL